MQIQSYISHHGIKGQRWGRRNGPPYPLGVGDHSASEKKAGWENSLSKESQRRIADSVKGDVKLTKKRFTWGNEYSQGLASKNKMHYSRYHAYHQDKLQGNAHVQKAYKDLEKSREDMIKAYQDRKDYYDLPENERKKFKIQAADEFYERYKDSAWYGDGSTLPDKKFVRLMFTDDDWDQGGVTDTPSFDKYLISKGKDPKEYVKNTIEADDKYRKAMNDYVDNMLGEFGSKPVHRTAKDVTVKKAVYDAIDRLSDDELYKRVWAF